MSEASTRGGARGVVVAIDGPAGAGKSTVARRVASELGYTLVDTGALYRAVALLARERGVSWDEGAAVGEVAASADIALEAGPSGTRVLVDGRDRSTDIREHAISDGASRVSAHPEVRAALLDLQRRLGAEGGVVLEGRDIGTVVFPGAEVKVFLTATDEERARRRHAELESRGKSADFHMILQDIRDRDRRDSTRPVAPLREAEDAQRVDSTGMSIDEVVDTIVARTRAVASR